MLEPVRTGLERVWLEFLITTDLAAGERINREVRGGVVFATVQEETGFLRPFVRVS